MDMDIDFVILWVDMNDPDWRAEFSKYSGHTENPKNSVSKARFRDYGFLKYWFRGVAKFAPWVRTIHFVTNCKTPDWLDLNNPKLRIVHHREIIPAEYLPTFNSGVIERYIHRIPSLSEHFVYFNDDFYIINHLTKERFFRNGLPCDIAAQKYNPAWSQWYKMLENNIEIINRHFSKREVMARDRDKWFDPSYGGKARWNHLLRFYPRFITLRTPHNAQPYLKSSFERAWAAAGKELSSTSANRFRASTDLTHELFRTWQICEGNFTPLNTYLDTKMFPLMIRSKQAIAAIREQRYNLVCLNDNVHIRNYDEVMAGIHRSFEHILSEKSCFEI